MNALVVLQTENSLVVNALTLTLRLALGRTKRTTLVTPRTATAAA